MEQKTQIHTVRYYEIDLLRFFAAFVVLLFHYTFRGYAADHLSPINYPALAEVFKYGYLGVELFFIISGYVVLMSAYDKTVRQFLVSRIVRLYPAFWVACTITFFVTYIFGPVKGSPNWSIFLDASVKQYLFNMTMLHEFFGIQDLDGVYWTLSYEIGFYFLISLLLSYRLLHRLPVLLGLWLIYALYAGHAMFTTSFATLLLPAYGPFFVAGMLFYLIQRKIGNSKHLYLLLSISWLVAIRNTLMHAQANEETYKTCFSPIIIATIISAFYVVFFLIVFRKLDLGGFKWLSLLGSLTYPLYLLHHNIGYVLFQNLYQKVNKYVLLMGIISFIILFAYLLHIYVERRYSSYFKSKVNQSLDYFN